MKTAAHQVTQLLEAIDAGDERAWSSLLPLIYEELQVIARRQLSRLKPGETLQTTDLVHETYLKLAQSAQPTWENRRHFFGAAAHSMRDILIMDLRRRQRVKRGGEWNRVSFPDAVAAAMPVELDLLALNEALDKLEEVDALQHEIVMLRFFGGLTIEMVSKVLGVSTNTVDRHWSFARAWLIRKLRHPE